MNEGGKIRNFFKSLTAYTISTMSAYITHDYIQDHRPCIIHSAVAENSDDRRSIMERSVRQAADGVHDE